jgi:acyl transferase domain-containing protein
MSAGSEQPIAIVSMAGIYPAAANLEELGANLLGGGSSPPVLASPAKIGSTAVDLARHGIPPAQASSMARVQLLVLEVVSRCLAEAACGASVLDRDRDSTDVIVGVCFGNDRAYANDLRVESARVIARFLETMRGADESSLRGAEEELKARGRKLFGGAAHDRLGEMASTIPARISIANRLRGRCMAIEAADATSFVALHSAIDILRRREASMVVVAAGQLFDGPLVPAALAAKGFLDPMPAPSAGGEAGRSGYRLAEGVGALLLKRLEDAERDGDRIYCSIVGTGIAHASQPGTFRYAASVTDRRAVLADALADAGCDPASIQYVECSSAGRASSLEIEALAHGLAGDGMAPRGVLLGCLNDSIGHTFAAAGVAAVTRVALGLHRRTVAPQPRGPWSDRLDLSRTPFELARERAAWPENIGGHPRRAAVAGDSFTGTIAYLVLEEHIDDAPARVRTPARVHSPGGPDEPPAPPIAIVGLGGRFARARDAADFWRNIHGKVDAIEPLPGRVVERNIYYDPDNLDVFTTYSVLGSLVEEPELPGDVFRIPPRRQMYMDRAQKLALAAARETFESFGHPARRLPDRRVAVIIGSSLCLNKEREANTAMQLAALEEMITGSQVFARLAAPAREAALTALRAALRDAAPPLTPWSADGFLASGVAAVISNQFRLNALPVAVEAACASSLAAIDLAVRGLATGRYDMVLTGGVDLPANARDLVVCSNLGLLSPTGIKPFDERADGVSVGEGIALFLLKRLDDALAEGDPVFAVLRALGASSDARSLVAPDAEGQALAIRRAFTGVEFAPDDVQYLEAHGTGTIAGDRAEVQAIASVYRNGGRSHPLALGSVKSMIGHTFAAAGAAGLLKTVLALRERTLPPGIHVDRVNPALGLESIPAYVVTDPEPWPAPPQGARRAAVSSMGTGGINYHLLVEEAPAAR